MTCIVALKSEYGWLIASDSFGSNGKYGECNLSPDIGKLVKYQYDKNLTIADCGSASKMALISATKGLTDYFLNKKEIDEKEGHELYDSFDIRYVIKEIIPKIYTKIDDLHLTSELRSEGTLYGKYLLAYKDNAFVVNAKSHVIEINDFYAMGSGAPGAIGYYLATNKLKDPLLTLLRCIKTGIESSEYCKFPIRITTSYSDEVYILSEDKVKELIRQGEEQENERNSIKEE